MSARDDYEDEQEERAARRTRAMDERLLWAEAVIEAQTQRMGKLEARIKALESDPRLLPFTHGMVPIPSPEAERLIYGAPEYPLEAEFAARPLVLMGKQVTLALTEPYARIEAGRALNLRERA